MIGRLGKKYSKLKQNKEIQSTIPQKKYNT